MGVNFIRVSLVLIISILFILWAVNWGKAAPHPHLSVVPVWQDNGGEIGDYLHQLRSNKFWAIRGACNSACTMRLAKGCVYPGALLGFHSPYVREKDKPEIVARGGDVGQIVARSRQDMLRTYPPGIQQWVLQMGALDTTQLTYLTGAQAIALGARDCRQIVPGQ